MALPDPPKTSNSAQNHPFGLFLLHGGFRQLAVTLLAPTIKEDLMGITVIRVGVTAVLTVITAVLMGLTEVLTVVKQALMGSLHRGFDGLQTVVLFR